MNLIRWALCLLLLAVQTSTYANAAMPGVWQGGAGARFVPLLPADSLAMQFIRMQREEVLVQLYDGYAVVKGTYWMQNQSAQPVDMLVGYPTEGTVNAPVVSHIVLGAPQSFRVLVDGRAVTAASGEAAIRAMAGADAAPDFSSIDPEKWLVWPTRFAPGAVTTITVYFLVDCSQARMRKGYSVKKGHAFAYVLESGRAWAGGIGEGSIKVQLKDALTIGNINGVLPAGAWKGKGRLLTWAFTNLEPDEKSNLLIWYNAGSDSIAFSRSVLPRASALYASIDAFDTAAYADAANWPALQKDDFSAGGGWLTGLLVQPSGLFVLLLAVGMVVLVYRKMKHGAGRAGKT